MATKAQNELVDKLDAYFNMNFEASRVSGALKRLDREFSKAYAKCKQDGFDSDVFAELIGYRVAVGIAFKRWIEDYNELAELYYNECRKEKVKCLKASIEKTTRKRNW